MSQSESLAVDVAAAVAALGKRLDAGLGEEVARLDCALGEAVASSVADIAKVDGTVKQKLAAAIESGAKAAAVEVASAAQLESLEGLVAGLGETLSAADASLAQLAGRLDSDIAGLGGRLEAELAAAVEQWAAQSTVASSAADSKIAVVVAEMATLGGQLDEKLAVAFAALCEPPKAGGLVTSTPDRRQVGAFGGRGEGRGEELASPAPDLYIKDLSGKLDGGLAAVTSLTGRINKLESGLASAVQVTAGPAASLVTVSVSRFSGRIFNYNAVIYVHTVMC